MLNINESKILLRILNVSKDSLQNIRLNSKLLCTVLTVDSCGSFNVTAVKSSPWQLKYYIKDEERSIAIEYGPSTNADGTVAATTDLLLL